MSDLVPLGQVPAILQRERAMLQTISEPLDMADMEKRLAAIADLTKRAGLAVPIQNEATFLRAEALQRLAELVDEHRDGYHHGSAEVRHIHRRVSEGRALARTNTLTEMEAEVRKRPETPVSMNDILKRAKRRERETALGGRREQAESAAKEQIRNLADPYELITSDIREWRPSGVDAIITDPPYIGDSIPLYEALRDFAVDVLPPGAPLVVMTWQAILPSVMRSLEHERLAYRWVICWRFANTENTADHKRRVFDCWKPVLVYHKDEVPADARMFRDEIANKDPDKDFHEWGQSVDGFQRLVTSFSEPGQMVCDPFLGGGTTAIAALSQTRRFTGCDIEQQAVDLVSSRLAT